MKEYKVGLTRTFIVTVKARNEEEAKQVSEFYLGFGGIDESTEKDRIEDQFEFVEVEAVTNEAFKI